MQRKDEQPQRERERELLSEVVKFKCEPTLANCVRHVAEGVKRDEGWVWRQAAIRMLQDKLPPRFRGPLADEDGK
jgi:hypothetical protein